MKKHFRKSHAVLAANSYLDSGFHCQRYVASEFTWTELPILPFLWKYHRSITGTVQNRR